MLGVGCLDGVCGSCSVMVRRIGEPELSMELGCQLLVEEGMEVFFSSFETLTQHHYDLSQINNPLVVHNEFLRIFPEAKNCRYCGGCNRACPKNIDVEQSVTLAVKGEFKQASALFVDCVMCNLCVSSCPENIEPNHVGLFARRVTSHFNTRPANLTQQIQAIRSGELSVDIDALDEKL
nr:4Fe-4S dicluster domain-containing protein [sulfur-oxidizing endosymbiont of Gigantopelta aegis]